MHFFQDSFPSAIVSDTLLLVVPFQSAFGGDDHLIASSVFGNRFAANSSDSPNP